MVKMERMCVEVYGLVGRNGSGLRLIREDGELEQLQRILERMKREMTSEVRYSYSEEIWGGRADIGDFVDFELEMVRREILRRSGRLDEGEDVDLGLRTIYGVL